MINPSTAIAIFVKTPGLSPLKTRLAAGIGTAGAVQFYRNSLGALQELLSAGPCLSMSLSPYWAVAEPELPEDHPWQGFPVVHQEQGDLGLRMGSVLAELQKHHEKVLFIGSDTPQLSQPLLSRALELLERHDVVFGPAADGGFYLMGTAVAIPSSLLQQVRYSADDTLSQLAGLLAKQHSVSRDDLPQLTDADTAGDLLTIAKQLAALPELLPKQRLLLSWLEGRLQGLQEARLEERQEADKSPPPAL